MRVKMKAAMLIFCVAAALALSVASAQTVEERTEALIRKLAVDPPVVLVNDEVSVGEPYGPEGPHGDFQVASKLRPGSPEYEAKAAKLREKRRRDIQAQLVALGPPATPYIGRALNNQTLPYREYLAKALASIGDKKAAPYLIDYLAEGHSKIRMARSLTKTGENERAQKMKREGELIIGAAVFSLETLTGQAYGDDIAKWRAWWERNKAH